MCQTFASRLRTVLQQRKLSISDLARKSQFSRQAIYNWLETDHISKSALEKLAKVLGVTPQWLRYGKVNGYKILNHGQFRPQTPFFSLSESLAFNQTKKQLSNLKILLGHYRFKEGAIKYYNQPDWLAITLPEGLDDLMSQISTKQAYRLRRSFFKLIKFQATQIFTLTIVVKGKQIFICSFDPIFDQQLQLEGLSFYLHPLQTSQQQLANYLKQKCKVCKHNKCR